MSRMFNPPHPGEILKEDVLSGLSMSVTDAAAQLSVTRVTLSRIINGRAGISPDMALRLAAWLETTPESWLNMQGAYDLWQAEQKSRPKIPLAQAANA
ncbi:MAG: HigA family addiction module antitoxin [Mariprofundaceae bacterium]